MRMAAIILSLVFSTPAMAQPDLGRIVENHVMPGYRALAEEAADLEASARADCSPDNAGLIRAYHNAFNAWVRVSHLRFGPSETNDRAFALAFWPDPRGSTPKALGQLIRYADPVVASAEDFATVSVASRGFYALEYLLFDPQFTDTEDRDYLCDLTQALATDIARNANAILDDWQSGYADLMANPGNDTYRLETEASRQLFTALSTGLEFTSQARLGRPLGTFERPRPNRAEAHRSGRSLQHVILSLTATRELASLMSGEDAGIDSAFENAIKRATDLEDPVFAGVVDPQSRFRVEVLQQDIDSIRQQIAEDLGPSLGIAAGFNSLDGD
ncbi:imelysin family protein [Sulfitobacter sp. F26204]|uniref:imelysin family protein n=1 Tax=Sulfitobacter sp. F26204 TaxID=2996014 RepID=UPI00225DE35F|nr:imelysin family protein [Sulfitobacter sp. F26204]MCX7561437.1 imelysin family protein [Sulfitobacter sp. F26204]